MAGTTTDTLAFVLPVHIALAAAALAVLTSSPTFRLAHALDPALASKAGAPTPWGWLAVALLFLGLCAVYYLLWAQAEWDD